MNPEKNWRNAKTNSEFNDRRVAWIKKKMGYAIEDLNDDKQFLILQAINSLLNSYDLLNMEEGFEENRLDLLESLLIRLNRLIEEESKSNNFVVYTLTAYWGEANESLNPDEELEAFVARHLLEGRKIILNIVYNGEQEVEVKSFDLSKYQIQKL